MKPMQPMEPMPPMARTLSWWPDGLGRPSVSGSQNGLRYAFFPDQRRLLIELEGELVTYDSGDHQIVGVAQQEGHAGSVTLTSQHGHVDLHELRRVS